MPAIEGEWLEGLPRYIHRTPSGEILWNYFYRGFFARPHRTPHHAIICIQPADMVFRPSIVGEDLERMVILEGLQNEVPNDLLRAAYGDPVPPYATGIGRCETGEKELVLAYRTRDENQLPTIWEACSAGIDKYLSTTFPNLYDQSA